MNISHFKKRRKRPVTADELIARLESEPAWVARQENWRVEQRKRIEEYERDAKDLVSDLAAAGFQVTAVSDLYNFGYAYRPVIPILLRWLPRINNLRVKEGIVRALTDGAAKPLAAPLLIEEFRTVTCPKGVTEVQLAHYKASVANGLSVVADDLVFEEIVDLIQDRRHGWSRAPLAIALQRMKNPAATDILMGVLDEDPDLNDPGPALIVDTIRALGNRKVSKARTKIERFLDHTSPIVRKEAQKSLDKIERAEQKTREKPLKKG